MQQTTIAVGIEAVSLVHGMRISLLHAFEAGADHVAVQLLSDSEDNLTDGFRTLAGALGLSS